MGSLVGAFVSIDKATENMKNIEYARIRVHVSLGSEVKMSKKIMINSKLCEVFIHEEHSTYISHEYKCRSLVRNDEFDKSTIASLDSSVFECLSSFKLEDWNMKDNTVQAIVVESPEEIIHYFKVFFSFFVLSH